jgi:hypothetical protein
MFDFCVQMKVSIFSGGEEKANIIFDVTGMGRDNWFRPENVVSSTFTGLPTTGSSFTIAQ